MIEALLDTTAAQVEKRTAYATKLCKGALDVNSWIIADKMAERFGICGGCIDLGVYPPGEPDDAPQKSSGNRRQGHSTRIMGNVSAT